MGRASQDADDNQIGDAVYLASEREAIAEERQMKLDIERGL
jgi:hypothetical protein